MAYVQRFSDRVQDYTRYRPSYPPALLDHLAHYGLQPGAVVMDAGSGTGILSELLLDRGATVYAVEPNSPMREESVRRLGTRSGFHAVPATAEETGLPESSIDLITAAQAFHWFDVTATRSEWTRVLRPGGRVADVERAARHQRIRARLPSLGSCVRRAIWAGDAAPCRPRCPTDIVL